MDKPDGSVSREIRKNFITGLLVVLPAFITLWIIWFFLSKIVAFALILIPRDIPVLTKIFWSIFIIILSVIAVIIIGLTTRNVIGKLIKFAEGIIHRIPVVKWIYETAKKIFEPF